MRVETTPTRRPFGGRRFFASKPIRKNRSCAGPATAERSSFIGENIMASNEAVIEDMDIAVDPENTREYESPGCGTPPPT